MEKRVKSPMRLKKQKIDEKDGETKNDEGIQTMKDFDLSMPCNGVERTSTSNT